MKMFATLSYLDIFKEPVPTVEELLDGLSSEGILTSLSIINAQLYADQSSEKQLDILADLLAGEDHTIIDLVVNKFTERHEKLQSVDIAIFSIRYSLEFIHYELLNYREGRLISSQAERINFFKAYLVICEHVTVRDMSANKLDFVQSKLWPLLVTHFSLEGRLNPFTEMLRSIMVFKHFESSLDYRVYHEAFLKKVGRATSWNYVFELTLLLAQGINMYQENDNTYFPWRIKNVPEFSSLFTLLSIDLAEYAANVNVHKAYIGIKEKPLFKSNGDFLVLSWKFVASKVYESLVFDFYKLSGIDEVPKFKDFRLFKKYISEEIVEKIMLRRILRAVFNGRGNVILFDDRRTQGFPDAYVRSGKYIYLFEIKDALFSADVIQNPSFDSVKKEIDTKFNNSKKGVGQLIKQIVRLEKESFEPQTFEELNVKRRNIVIFPIILYTDRQFGMPGIGQYLNNEFENRLREKSNLPFSAVKPLTTISLSFLTDNLDLISDKNHKLKDVILSYHQALKQRDPSKLKSNPIDNSVMMNETIEQYVTANYRKNLRPIDLNYIQRILSALQLSDNSPEMKISQSPDQ